MLPPSLTLPRSHRANTARERHRSVRYCTVIVAPCISTG